MITSDISVEYVDHMGSDLSVVNAARVSFDKTSEWGIEERTGIDENGYYSEDIKFLKESDTKLIRYLAKHKHYSPFNHTFLTVRVKAPIFVSRQMVKHEYMPWNEVSRRYVDSEPEFYIPPVLRKVAESVKQGSSNDPIEQHDWHHADIGTVCRETLDIYNAFLAAGVCPEQARMILPQNLMTEWIWSGTLKAFHKMLSLRLDPHTQYETRLVAERILPIVEEHFPISIKALLDE